MTNKKRSKPTLHAVRFSKKELMSLSDDERELFLRVGLIVNELMLFQRIWVALLYRDPKTTLATEVHAIQTSLILIAIVGKIHEGTEIFDKRFLSTLVGREYLKLFSYSQQKSVKKLKLIRGANSIFSKIRNQFAFHFHNESPLSPFVAKMSDEQVLFSYLGMPDGNTFHTYAATPFLNSLLQVTGKPTPGEAIEKIMDDAGDASAALNHWITAVQTVAIGKMLGDKVSPVKLEIGDGEYLPQNEINFPFFMNVPTRKKGRRKSR